MRQRRSSAARRLGRSTILTTAGDAASLQPLALHSIHASRRACLRRSPPPPSPSVGLQSCSTPPRLQRASAAGPATRGDPPSHLPSSAFRDGHGADRGGMEMEDLRGRCKAWNHKEAQIGKCISSLCGHFSGDLVEKIKIEKSEDALFPHGRYS
uniref:Uncharacterized protein n=1 Tax=Oryza meridionalis TaxID=40149 RepID=A0A0E0ECE4_9ORYZ